MEENKKAENINDSGVGKNTSDGSFWGILFWAIIIICAFKGCGT